MDKNQKEFTEKIRSAIKQKLAEINAFVDDELPDYIMILVANKRSKSQIEKDLVLFLGNDTPAFTSWLWDLVKNLKVNSKVKSSTSVPKKIEESKKKDPQSDEDADVLDYDLDEQESDILDQEEDLKKCTPDFNSKASKISNVSATSTFKTVDLANKKVEKDTSDVQHISRRPDPVFPLSEIRNVPVVSTVMPVQQQHIVNLEDEYDPTKPDFSGNVSSVVHISQRNYGGPAALQANKLLLRAVNDATKSVLHGQNINDFYKPTPIKVLSSNRRDNSPRFRNLVSVKIDSNFEFPSQPKEPEITTLNQPSDESEFDALDSEDYILSNTPGNNRTICLTSDTTDLNVFEGTSNSSQSLIPENEQVDSPHFIVTLDGVDFSLKRKYSATSDGSMEMDEDGFPVSDTDGIPSVPEKKQKVVERCKYWPACKNSDDCVFYHPTVPCQCFPDCKFGDRCLYIHPNCKFDALCSRKDCPYTHASKRKFPIVGVPAMVPMKKRSTKTVCKFYPKCTVSRCPFVHPKLCRYGTKCRVFQCPFSHFNIPSRNQMKWKASV